MQAFPDLLGYTGPIGGPSVPLVPNVAVAHLLSPSGTLIGTAFFDRTKAPQSPTAFGRDTDSWHWSTAGSEWPSAGFRLRIRSKPVFEPYSGVDYAIWPDSPFVPTTAAPPTQERYRIVREESETETVVGELLVEQSGTTWRQRWWAQASALTSDRIPFEGDIDYRFEPMSGETTLDTATLRTVDTGFVSLTTVTL